MTVYGKAVSLSTCRYNFYCHNTYTILWMDQKMEMTGAGIYSSLFSFYTPDDHNLSACERTSSTEPALPARR